MRKIDISKQAEKYLMSLSPKQRKQITRNVIALQTEVRPPDSKKLTGYAYSRVDSGEYRIIYEWDERVVYIVVIGKRNDGEVYKKLRKRSR